MTKDLEEIVTRAFQESLRVWRTEREVVQTFLTALSAAGYVVVPRESTRAMYEAGDAVACDAWQGGYPVDADEVWKAYIDAAAKEGK